MVLSSIEWTMVVDDNMFMKIGEYFEFHYFSYSEMRCAYFEFDSLNANIAFEQNLNKTLISLQYNLILMLNLVGETYRCRIDTMAIRNENC
jgi:hypothetical protein